MVTKNRDTGNSLPAPTPEMKFPINEYANHPESSRLNLGKLVLTITTCLSLTKLVINYNASMCRLRIYRYFEV